MSLGLANNSAMGGLRLSALGTRLVAENLANAETEGFGQRNLVPTSTLVNGHNTPIQRVADPVLLGATRRAESTYVHADVLNTGLAGLERAFGLPGEADSLNDLATSLASSLQQAASTPDSTAGLQTVAQDATRLAAKFNRTEQQIQSIRQQADTSIAKDVGTLNDSLGRVAALNKDIQRQMLLGGDPNGLMDERQRVVSDIAQIIPVTEIPRENGRIMLLAANGQVLAENDHAQFSFAPTIGIGATDSLAAGALAAVTLDGRALGPDSAITQSGRLGANLELRDTIAPGAQTRLDALAQDLLARFSGPQADTTLSHGEFGLFTLPGAATSPADATGLAGKLSLSSRFDPATDTGLWRLRTGLNAVAPGPTSDPANLTRMAEALDKSTTLFSGTPAHDLTTHVAAQVSALATARLQAENDLSFAQAHHTTLQEDFARNGVDTDTQMQRLLTLERAYAANARVLSAVDGMMRNLLEI